MESVCPSSSSKIIETKWSIPIFHISRKKIKKIDTENIIPQFHAGYIFIPFKKNKKFRAQVGKKTCKVWYKDFTGNWKQLKVK